MTFITVTNWFGGKSVFFAFWFFVFGIILAFIGKLSPTYLGLAASVQTLVALRSVADDYHERSKNGNGAEKK